MSTHAWDLGPHRRRVYGAEPKPGHRFVKPNAARRIGAPAPASQGKIKRYIEIQAGSTFLE
jgi:hypothetical protein